MNSFVYDYLRDTLHEKEFELYLQIGNLIEHFGLEDNYQMLEDIVYNEDLDTSGKHDNIAHFFLNIAGDMLKKFGVKVSEETKLSEYVKIIEGLLYLEQTEHYHHAIDVINSLEDDPEECLCVLLSVVTTEHEAFYQPLIVGVETSLIERIYEKMMRFVDEEEVNEIELTQSTQTIRKNIRSMLQLYNSDGSYSNIRCLELVSVIGTTEMTFERLAGIMNDYIFDDDPEKTALNLYTITISAVDTCDKPLFFLQNDITKHFPMEMDLYQTLLPMFKRIHDGFERTNKQ